MANMIAASKAVLIEWRIVILFPKYAFGCGRFEKDLKLEHCKDKPLPETKVAFGEGRFRALAKMWTNLQLAFTTLKSQPSGRKASNIGCKSIRDPIGS
jgi:hypothetical protein